jgi:hypothetical protein
MNRRSDSSKISLFPQRSVFTKTSPAYREKKPNKPANKKDGGKKKEGKDKDKKEQTKVEDGLFNALVTVFGLGVLLAVIAMVCGGMFGSASRYHS